MARFVMANRRAGKFLDAQKTASRAALESGFSNLFAASVDVVNDLSPSDELARRVVAEALGYVENNRGRMDYPRYRRLGLPVSSAAVESTIKQINRRVKGTEKFWLEGGFEAVLQLRAAHLSEDGRSDDYWSRPRPYARAAGQGSLRPAS